MIDPNYESIILKATIESERNEVLDITAELNKIAFVNQERYSSKDILLVDNNNSLYQL